MYPGKVSQNKPSMSQYFPFKELPSELQCLVISFADTDTCITLLRSSCLLQQISKKELEKRVKTTLDRQNFLVSVYCANNKVSSCDKFYYQAACLRDSSNNATFFLGDLVKSENLFSKAEKSLAVWERDSEAFNMLNNNVVPLLINDDVTKFKCTIALLLQSDTGSKTKLFELSPKFEAKDGQHRDDNLHCRHYKDHAEPPRHDYDYESFHNYRLVIDQVTINKYYLLKQVQASKSE